LGCEKHPEAAGTLDRLARVVKIPAFVDDYDVLRAVVASPAAHGRGVGAKLTTAGSHAVTWCMAFGTKTVGFLKLAIFGLRTIEYPPRAVAITTEMIAVHASCLFVRTASTQS
jgi:GNAT superfamily N-acetyltransferase